MKIDGCVAYSFTPNETKNKIELFISDTYGVRCEADVHFVSYRSNPIEVSFHRMKLTQDERVDWEKVVRDIYRISTENSYEDDFGHTLLQLVFGHPIKKYLFSKHDIVNEYVYRDEDRVYVFVDKGENLPLASDEYVEKMVLDWKP